MLSLFIFQNVQSGVEALGREKLYVQMLIKDFLIACKLKYFYNKKKHNSIIIKKNISKPMGA